MSFIHWYNYTTWLRVNQSWIKIIQLKEIDCQVLYTEVFTTRLTPFCPKYVNKRIACTFTLETLTRNLNFHVARLIIIIILCCMAFDSTTMSTKSNKLKAILSRHWLIYLTPMEWNRSCHFLSFSVALYLPSIWCDEREKKSKPFTFTYLLIKQKANSYFKV